MAKYAAPLYYTSWVAALCAGAAAGFLAFTLTVHGILPPICIIEGHETAEIPEPLRGSLLVPGEWRLHMLGDTGHVGTDIWAESTRGTIVFLLCRSPVHLSE
jgi:hypothetical protein